MHSKDILAFVAESAGETSRLLGAREREKVLFLLKLLAGELTCYDSAFSTR